MRLTWRYVQPCLVAAALLLAACNPLGRDLDPAVPNTDGPTLYLAVRNFGPAHVEVGIASDAGALDVGSALIESCRDVIIPLYEVSGSLRVFVDGTTIYRAAVPADLQAGDAYPVRILLPARGPALATAWPRDEEFPGQQLPSVIPNCP